MPARISVPMPWPWNALPSHDPVTNVRRLTNSSASSLGTPTTSPSTITARFDVPVLRVGRGPAPPPVAVGVPFPSSGEAASVHGTVNGISSDRERRPRQRRQLDLELVVDVAQRQPRRVDLEIEERPERMNHRASLLDTDEIPTPEIAERSNRELTGACDNPVQRLPHAGGVRRQRVRARRPRSGGDEADAPAARRPAAARLGSWPVIVVGVATHGRRVRAHVTNRPMLRLPRGHPVLRVRHAPRRVDRRLWQRPRRSAGDAARRRSC